MNEDFTRGRSQIMFKFLPGAVFLNNTRYYKVTNLELSKVNFDTSRLEDEVMKFINKWSLNEKLRVSLFPKDKKKFYFGEIQKVEYELFPLVFKCSKCENVHEYFEIDRLKNDNPTLNCMFCDAKSSLIQFQYVMIHANGDLKGLRVTHNGGSNFKEKYEGITMHDTRSFVTASWFNKKKNLSLGPLGSNLTSLQIVDEMKPYMSGKHAADGDVFRPTLLSIVNLNNDELENRMSNIDFSYIQLSALLEMSRLNKIDFNGNFKIQESNNLAVSMLAAAKNEKEKEIILSIIKERLNQDYLLETDSFRTEIDNLVNSVGLTINDDSVKNDRLLHEYLYSIYESGGTSLQDKIIEASQAGDYLQTDIYERVEKKINVLGIQSAMLLDNFPVLTASPGFTRKSTNRNEVILNPYKQKIQGSLQTIVPVLLSDNEAIIIKMNPLRILKWLQINQLLDLSNLDYTREEAELFLYFKSNISKYETAELAEVKLNFLETFDEKMLAATIFQLLHTVSHMMLNSGKAIIGLDIDSISEYLFPSSLAFALYVSKIEGGGMGNLIAAYENDFERWINATFDHTQLCLYDPVCKDHKAACHACSYLKFSCQHFNRGLTRTLLIGGILGGKELIGFFDSRLQN